MKTNYLSEQVHMPPGKPMTTEQELLTATGNGGVCKECLNEDFDSCVCPEPENGSHRHGSTCQGSICATGKGAGRRLI